MKKIISYLLLALAVIFLIVISLYSSSNPDDIDDQINIATLVATPVNNIQIQDKTPIDELPIEDNQDLYQYHDPGSIVYMYVTVREGNPSDGTDYTWEEVNDFTKWFFLEMRHIEVGKAEAILQIGNEQGPIPGELGYGEIVPNATIQIRGASSSSRTQKSYKIELRDRAGRWRGQSTIALNKHPGDLSRVKNKLSFDLLKGIPDVVSLRTQFVRLYIKDETSDPPGNSYVDYGLFTQVEQPNKRFLENHLLDPGGHFYKANFFEFYRYPEKIQPKDSAEYNQEAFDTVLEIKGDHDHQKIIQMLEDVNNWTIPIQSVFEKHFNADNYFTWMAFNILSSAIDTQTQNFYLYSPKNSQTWYFIPWDYDNAWAGQESLALGKEEHPLFAYGISNYWGAVLHNRVLRIESYRAQLDEKVDEVRAYLSPKRIERLLETYRETTEPLIFQMPDLYYLPGTKNEYDLQYKLIPSEVEVNYNLYLKSLESPMPFFLGTPRADGGQLFFHWDEAYDFDAEDITYRFQISSDWDFNEILYDTEVKNITETQIDLLDEGTYFWRVIATNESGYQQYPFDAYIDAERERHSGMKILYITSDGRVLEE